jgi:hypothetical protein
MMTRPRVTEIAVTLAPVEPDPFIAAPSRDPAAQRRLSEREARPAKHRARPSRDADAVRPARPRRLSYAGRRQSRPSTRTSASENGSVVTSSPG